MNFLRSQRGVVAAVVVALLALFLTRPGADRLRSRIVRSLSLAVGRRVEVSSVHLRLLPAPGFELQNFVVYEDPVFGVEPTLRADEVTATLRVTSLLRGRLEIAALSFTEPSINLVQDATGHWNLENLLQRAQETQAAPTRKARSEPRPAFPYIQADRSRINFKFGAEKMPYSLTSADFSLWQDSENAWGMRLKAQPMRSDLNLSDTGMLFLEGSWQRAASLRDTPLQFTASWERAQLGQLSKLAYGRDPGWRGVLRTTMQVQGTPADLNIRYDGAIDDFHRYDLAGGSALLLSAHCDGQYSSLTHALHALTCRAPVGGGFLALEGSVEVAQPHAYDLALTAQNIPLPSLVAFARHAKKNLPTDLAAAGLMDGAFTFKYSGIAAETPDWAGRASLRGLRITSKLAKADIAIEKIPLILALHNPASGGNASLVDLSTVEAGPFNLPLGRPAPAVVHGQFSRAGYHVGVEGEAQISRVLQLARILGLPAPQPAAEGMAKVDLQLTGSWSAFTAPMVTGKAQLHAVHAEMRGLNQPLEISAANVFLVPGEVDVKNISASLGESAWHGSVTLPRQCAEPGTCPVRFDLHADSLATEQLVALLASHHLPWYQFLSTASAPSVPFLRTLHASGKLAADQVSIRKLQASQVSANLEIENGRLRLSDLRGQMLGGRHQGEWTADFSVKPPAYSASGKVQGADLDTLAALMHDGWISGSADADYHLTSSGWTLADFLENAASALDVHAANGMLPHITLAGSGGLVMRGFDGRLSLRNGKFEVQQGKLDTPAGIYQVSGTASLSRVLDLKLMREGAGSYEITGTLTQPHVVQTGTAETQAALKP